MRKYLLTFVLSLCCALSIQAQGMSDDQVLKFIAAEAKAGTSQSQIVTKLVQRGVKIEQIRRLRKQYDKQIKERGASGVVDGAISAGTSRANSKDASDPATRDVTTGQYNSEDQIRADASEDVAEAEQEVKAEQNTAPDAQGKRVYGRDIFNQRALTFEPNPSMAVPTSYVLGPGDQVVVDIYGASQETLIHTISPEGTITVSGYGPIQLSGLTVAAAQSKLRATLGTRYQTSSLQLNVGNTRTIMINVMGEVSTPGTYHLSPFANVFYALYRAGGISDLGSLRNVKVYRNGRLVTVVDIYKYILEGRLAGNITLQDNDLIQVEPYEALVGVTGNVKRPMFYEMRKDETVATLIKYAGGFTGDAYKNSVRLVRQSGERYQVFNVGEFEMSSFRLEDGDAISVDGMINRYENMVEIKGAVFRPGQFQLGGKVNSVKSLIESAEGLTEDAFTTHAVMHRMKPDRSLEVVPIDLKGILNGSVADIPLQNEDVLFIPTQEKSRSERTLTITGEVMDPGTYEYADNTTVEDLIIQAGGLTDQASMARVDVSRRLMDPHSTAKTHEISKTFSFDLEDGLVINSDRTFVLMPYDVVHVRYSPSYSTPRNITVEGEVNYEGAHTLKSRNQRLSDAINMAGGITDDAYLRGATLVRHMIDEERVRMQATMKAVQNLLTERGDSLSYNKLNLDENYPVAIDLDAALKNPGSDADIVLREGDRIFVPEYNGIVKISGDVFFPNTVFYEKGKSWKKYVEQAGGFGHRAKKSKAFIVYQNGSVGLTKKGAKPEPGCEIVVPSKRTRQSFNLANVLGLSTSLTSMAAMIATIANMTK